MGSGLQPYMTCTNCGLPKKEALLKNSNKTLSRVHAPVISSRQKSNIQTIQRTTNATWKEAYITAESWLPRGPSFMWWCDASVPCHGDDYMMKKSKTLNYHCAYVRKYRAHTFNEVARARTHTPELLLLFKWKAVNVNWNASLHQRFQFLQIDLSD